jgi:hypothetical protein
VPVTGAVPVTAITETAEYTGTVAWSGSPAVFAGLKVYTATITLTAKAGYTFTGVVAGFFTLPGADTVSNSADSGVVIAEFPATLAVLVGDACSGGADFLGILRMSLRLRTCSRNSSG